MRSVWPTGGLWRHGDFLKLWSAETISQFGTQISQLALPLVALLVLDASTFEVAALGVVEFLPFILFTLPAGVWVDRLPRRPILIAGDFGRFLLLATIPIAYVGGRAHARASCTPSASSSASARSSSTSPTSRTSLRSSSGADHRRQLEARDQPLDRRRSAGRASQAASSSSSRRPTRCSWTRSASSPPASSSSASARPRRRRRTCGGGRAEAEHVGGAQGGAPLRPREPQPPRPGRLHGDLELLLHARVLDLPGVPRARARASRRA